MYFLGNSGSFSTIRQPPKRWVCPFQEGVNLSPFCDNEKCGCFSCDFFGDFCVSYGGVESVCLESLWVDG